MGQVTKESLRPIIEHSNVMGVSVYMPTHKSPSFQYVQQDKTRLKNLIRDTKAELEKAKTDAKPTKTIIGHLESKLNDEDFWLTRNNGLVIFLDGKRNFLFDLPVQCDEKVMLSDHFEAAPLLVTDFKNKDYYLLVLAEHSPKIFKGSVYGLTGIDVELPESPEKALNIDEMFSGSNTMRGTSTSTLSRGTLPTHGQGDSNQAGSEERLMFFRMIDDKILNSDQVDDSLPLLIAGTDDLVADYKDISNHRKIVESYLNGNHTVTPLDELHIKAWPIVSDELNGWLQELLIEKFSAATGAGKASIDSGDITEAVKQGRVDTLILSEDLLIKEIPDDPNNFNKALTFTPEYGELNINQLALEVVRQSGEVATLRQGSMPEKAKLAAVYRY